MEQIRINNKDYDLIIITEPWIKQNELKYYEIQNYDSILYDRKQKNGGGILIYVKNSIDYEIIEILTDKKIEKICLKINQFEPYFITSYYCPPNINKIQLLDIMEKEFEKLNNQNQIIIGDFNMDLKQNNEITKSYRDLLKVNNLINLINKPTRITKDSKTLIDHLYTNKPQNILNIQNYNFDITDHNIIEFKIENRNKKVNNNNKPKLHSHEINNNYDIENYTKILKDNIRINKIDVDENNINEQYDKLMNSINEAVDQASAKNKTSKNIQRGIKIKPWANNTLLKEIIKKNNFYRYHMPN
jgi:hypothetical protein